METDENINEYIFPNGRKEQERNHLFEIISSIKSGPEQRTCHLITKWLLKRLFWSVIYLAGSYVTIKTCWNLCQDYGENQTTISMTASMGSGIKLPNITVCIPLNLTEMFPLTSTSETPYSDAMNDFFAKYTVDGQFQFKPYNLTLPIPFHCPNMMFLTESYRKVIIYFTRSDLLSFEVFFVLQKYLAMLYKAENLQEHDQNPFINLRNQTSDDYKALLDILVPKIAEFNISMEQIMSIFVGFFQLYPYYFLTSPIYTFCDFFVTISSQTVCRDTYCYNTTGLYMPVFVFSIDYMDERGSVTETISNNSITYWDENQICLTVDALNKVLQYNLAKSSNVDLQISFNDIVHPFAQGDLSVNFNGSGIPPDITKIGLSNEIYALGIREMASNTITVQFVNRSLSAVNGEERCSMDETRHECEVGCRKTLIQKFCGCLPIMLRKYTTEVATEKEQQCTFAQYENCLNYSGKEDEECRTKCLESCEHWQYDISHSSIPNPQTIELFPGAGETRISISITRFDFLIFQEYFQWTLSDFIAAFSGALALCFGISFVDLITFVTNLLSIITGKLRTVLKQNIDDETTETVDQRNAVNLLKKILAFFNIEGPTHSGWLSAIKWVTGMIFWAVIYTAGGIITAIFCKTLVEQYQSNLTYTSLTINYNTSYSLPPPTLCISLTSNFAAVVPSLNISSLKGYFSTTNSTKEEFMQQNNGSTWPIEMTYTVFWYLGILYYSETSMYAFDFATDVIVSSYNNDTKFMEALNEILSQLDQWNVTTDQLRQKLGFEFKEMLNFKVTFGDSKARISLNNTLTTAIIFSLTTESFFMPPPPPMLAALEFGGAPFLIPPCLFSDYISSQDCPLVLDSSSPFTDLSLRINSVINSDPGNPDAPLCSNEETQEICRARCRIKLIEKICNCSPTTWPTLLSPSKECSWNDYVRCLKYNVTENLADMNKCLPPCRMVNIDSNKTDKTITSQFYNSLQTNRWRIFIADFTYPSFEQLPQMTFFEFVAAFGGTLGVILGLDLRLLSWLLFTPIFAMFAFICKRKQSKNFLTKPEKHKVFLRIVDSQAMRKIASIFDFSLLSVKKMSRFTIIKYSVYYIFWSVVYIGSGFLTFLVSWPLFLDFKNDKLTINVQFLKNNSVFLPSPVVCLPIFLLNMRYEGDESENAENLVQMYFQNSAETLLNSTWNSPLLGLVQMYISKYGNFEMPDPDETISANNITEKLYEIFTDMDVNMDLLNVTLERLRQKFGNEIRKQFAFEISFHQNNNLANGSVYELETIFVSESKICYKIDTHFIEFKSTADFVKIYINGAKAFEGYNDLVSYGTVTMDLEGRNVVTNRSNILYGTIPMRFGENITATLEILSVIKDWPTSGGTEKCTEKQTEYDCQNHCLVQAILNRCKCTPRLLKLTTQWNDMEKCSLKEYGQCFALAFNDSQQCWKNCLSSCEMFRFGLTVSTSFIYEIAVDNTSYSSFLPAFYQYEAEMHLRIKSFTYQFYEQQLFYTIDSFIGAFGGALGVFIGLYSFIFVQFGYGLFVGLLDVCINKKWSKIQATPPNLEEVVVEIL